MQQCARPPWPRSPKAGGANEGSPAFRTARFDPQVYFADALTKLFNPIGRHLHRRVQTAASGALAISVPSGHDAPGSVSRGEKRSEILIRNAHEAA
jgi:hypothetical protein